MSELSMWVNTLAGATKIQKRVDTLVGVKKSQKWAKTLLGATKSQKWWSKVGGGTEESELENDPVNSPAENTQKRRFVDDLSSSQNCCRLRLSLRLTSGK